MAADNGLPLQSARPSDVPSDVGGTTLGFVCSRDIQPGEVLCREPTSAAAVVARSLGPQSSHMPSAAKEETTHVMSKLSTH